MANNQQDEKERFPALARLAEKYLWFKILLHIVCFPFWLIYMIIKFIMNFSKVIINTILIIILVSLIAGGIIYAKYAPIYEEASQQAYEKLTTMNRNSFRALSNTVVYDKDGKKIGETNSGSYKYAKIGNISPYIQKGYIAAEDKHFTEHRGVDLQSILRAALSIVSHNGAITQGGSTITQQVIKNNFLTQEKSMTRKATEVLLAPELEKKFNKSDIMEFYCNSNYFGNLCYGVETASRFYFGCSAKDVSIAQAAMLCGISNSPNKYNPIASMELATKRKEWVLMQMFKAGFITSKQYNKAKKEKIKVVGIGDNTGAENYMVSYAIDCAILQLMEKDGFEFKYTFANYNEQKEYKKRYASEYSNKSALIRAGGYKIYTSFDQKIQEKLQKSVSKTLSSFTEKNKKTKKYALQSAAMCIDNNTQYVVAVVGGRSKKDEYNRAFLSTRQPGSTIKPILDYGPAVDNGVINASSIINDSKVYWIDGNKNSYSPSNAGGGYRGRLTAREGLARSLNTVAFQILKKTGIETSISYLDKLKFSSLSYADSTAPAIALGGFTNGVTVNNMCRAYATLENNGQMSSRTCITKMDHETQGNVYTAPEKEDSETEVYSADTSFIMKDMMQGTFNESYGTGHSAFNSEQVYAGKTGTTNSSKDAWFCGFSSYYTTSVWIGYDTPRVMPGMYGNSYPLKIWANFMNGMHAKKEMKDFEVPQTISLRRVINGHFSGSGKQVSYSDKKRVYNQRPGGYDYYSNQNSTRKSAWEKTYKLEQTKLDAERAVSAWEKYKVNSVEKALAFENRYQKVITIIEKIPDEYEQSTFKERAAKKYESLSDIVKNDWTVAIEEYRQKQSEIIAEQRKTDAEDAKQRAAETTKRNRLEKVRWYINKLRSRKYYTDAARSLIKRGNNALAKIIEYTEYDGLKSKWDAAVNRAQNLPTEPPKRDPTNPSVTDPDSPNNQTTPATQVPATTAPENPPIQP
ncbi:transglycosylase domain-containing protein [Eubacterium xylanophilum]|uniref:transglycosylase domain-containing protein n=1 Tax=Eubacterium xylanophilum TaxID=39497 RepID=UPI0004B24685|nr:transglycosylase domain-containing protein [Eubacterium xylanophilum]